MKIDKKIHERAIWVLGPSEAIHKLQEEAGELHFAVQRCAQGKGDALSVIKELEDVLFVFQRVKKIWRFDKDIQNFEASEHRRQAGIKLAKAINDKMISEGMAMFAGDGDA